MKIMALNCGSSSIKYAIFDCSDNYRLLKHGQAERIGQKNSTLSHYSQDNVANSVTLDLPNHQAALQALFQNNSPYFNSHDLNNIRAVGHRVVHGGELLFEPTVINDEVIKEISNLARFAPLHCQSNVTGIEIMQAMLPKISHVAIFDTATHANMPSKAYMYALPVEIYEKYKIRKYGFHGINHSYMATQSAHLLNKELCVLKIITCHLGNGCSISAFEKGISIDNSMGLTPLEGLVMGTRSGDIDPAIVTYLIEELGWHSEQIIELLNKKSGLLGLCGKSDMRDIIKEAQDGNAAAQMALEIFVYRIQKYIGAYVAALNGVDAIVFSGGIGENSPYLRSLIAQNFGYLNIDIEKSKNEKNEAIFSSSTSSSYLLTVPANEELVIAQQTFQKIK